MDITTPYSFMRDLKATMANEREKLTAIKKQLVEDGAWELLWTCRELEKMIQEFQDKLEFKKTA